MQMRSLPQARAPRRGRGRRELRERLGFSVPRPPPRKDTGDPWPSDKELMAKNFLNKKSSRATKTTQGVLHKIYSIQKKKKTFAIQPPPLFRLLWGRGHGKPETQAPSPQPRRHPWKRELDRRGCCTKSWLGVQVWGPSGLSRTPSASGPGNLRWGSAARWEWHRAPGPARPGQARGRAGRPAAPWRRGKRERQK